MKTSECWYDACETILALQLLSGIDGFIPDLRFGLLTMPQSYNSFLVDRFGVLTYPAKGLDQVRTILHRLTEVQPVASSDLQLSRLVTLLMVVLLLTFGAVFNFTDAVSQNAIWLEIALSFAALFTFAASYRSDFFRRHLDVALRGLCYLAAVWFITLAALNGFQPNYAVGLLFIIPGLGVGYSVTLRKAGKLAIFFATTVAAASAACLIYGASSISPSLYIASLICIALVTLFVAAARLDAQKQFHAIEERYRAVVEQASDGIYLLDARTLTFLDANPAFCSMVGMTLDEVKKRSVTDLIVAPSGTVNNPFGHTFDGSRAHVAERMLRKADGSIIYVELHIDRIRYTDREALSVVVRDVSSRKEYESRLVKAKENAEEISRFKSSLLANMSHEIRTPLCSILGWTNVLNEELPERQRELVKLIEQSGRRLHNTLDSVLELAHLDANSKKLQPILVDVMEEVRSVAVAVEPEAERKGLVVSIQNDGMPIWTRVDVASFRRVLNHVVDNAIKFTDAGTVTLSVGATATDIRIDVADTGSGISEEFLPSIFEEFKQESAGLDRDHEGNGLGLAIVKRLVDLLGGNIEVSSRRGVGTTFSLYFPSTTRAGQCARVA